MGDGRKEDHWILLTVGYKYHELDTMKGRDTLQTTHTSYTDTALVMVIGYM